MKTRKTRSKNWRRPVWAAFWAMLFFLLLGGQFFCIRTGSGELFSGEEWVFPAGTFSQSQLDELDQEGRYGYLCRTPGTVALPKTGEERNVQVGLGNQAYGEICGISFQYGRWFEEGAGEVVLSRRLSEALFGEKNPCGLTLAVDGRELMICGVYSQRQGFLSQLSGDGSEFIFTSRKDYGGGEGG